MKLFLFSVPDRFSFFVSFRAFRGQARSRNESIGAWREALFLGLE